MSREFPKPDLSRVRIALCGLNRQVLLPIRSELTMIGYRNVEWVRSDGELRGWIQSGLADLILVDHEIDNGATIRTVREIRNGDLGENPFAVIIMTILENDLEHVKAAINSGVDDLIVAPYSTGQILERIAKLAGERKPFIATSDYIGPERRHTPDRKSDIPTFEPPNTLRMRHEGGSIDMAELRGHIASSITGIREEKLRRIGLRISALVEQIPGLVDSAGADSGETATGAHGLGSEAIPYLRQLARMSGEAVGRLGKTRYAGAGQLCRSMYSLARRIAADPAAASAKDTELLKPLSRAILEAFWPSEGTGEAVGEITGALSGYNARKDRVSGD